MKSAKFMAILASAGLLLAAGCTISPIYNVSAAPVVTNKQNPTLDEVGKAIIHAGTGLGWQMKEIKPGQIVGTLVLRTHRAVVDVTYDTKSYGIAYKDSENLDYDGKNIHRNYNGWVQNLDKGIRAQLSGIY